MRRRELLEVRFRAPCLDNPEDLVPLEEVDEVSPLLRLASPDAAKPDKERCGVPVRHRQTTRHEVFFVQP